jgi:ribA/ribD-fused uncharacterized protein
MAPKITKPKHKPSSKPKAASLLAGAPNPATEPSSSDNPSLFFYGHTSGPYDLFSQHYACTFTAPPLSFTTSQEDSAGSSTSTNPPSAITSVPETLTFHTTEQYMMYHKALLFGDAESAAQIMATPIPAEQKALGRKVVGFDERVWKAHRERIVEEGNWWKFTNGTGDAGGDAERRLKERLLETGERELVEASPSDRIWGIGFGRNNAEANRGRWGLNLLGKALMRVRERLREEGGQDGDEEMVGE